jgi:glycosyltransferase involved in cell wall biosynthesis
MSWLTTALSLLVAIPGLYLGLLGVAASFPRKLRAVRRGELRTFCVIVPAHNEAARIGELLDSLRRQSYPKDRLRTVVVADNCTDETATIARSAGALVIERSDIDRRGKGYALEAGLRHIPNDAGAVLFVDGDCTISENALHVLNERLEAGARAIQCRYEMAIDPASTSGAARRLALTLVHVVRPLAKERLHASAGLKGSGMCFDRALIEMLGWRTHGLAEDIEQHVALLRLGERVQYEQDVIVTGEAPTHLAAATSQHERWESGRIEVASRLGAPLMIAGLRKRSIAMIDAAIEILIPPLSVVVVALLAVSALAVVRPDRMATVAILCSWFGLVAYIAAGIGRANLRRGALARMPITLPAYAAWKVALYARALIVRPKSWNPTQRDD